jgi:uncharacterized membrane protein YcaP (DUF421 family)
MMQVDWPKMFTPEVSLLELVLRGTAIYFVLFAMLRILVRRHVGALNLTDLLVIVLIADAAQNGMAAEYRSLPEAIILCGTIIGWSYLFDWLAYRFDVLRPLFEPSPLPVVVNGEPQRQNMRQELVTSDELMSHLRVQGVEGLKEVRLAYIEPDGQVSVLKFKDRGGNESAGPEQKGAVAS